MSTDLPDNVLFGGVGSHLANNVLFGRAKGEWLLLAAGYVPTTPSTLVFAIGFGYRSEGSALM